MSLACFYTLYTHDYTHIYTLENQCWHGFTRFTRISRARTYVRAHARVRARTCAHGFFMRVKRVKRVNLLITNTYEFQKRVKKRVKVFMKRVKGWFFMKRPPISRNFIVVDSADLAMRVMHEQAEREQACWCIGTHPAGYIVMRYSWAMVHGIRHSVSYTPRIKTEE